MFEDGDDPSNSDRQQQNNDKTMLNQKNVGSDGDGDNADQQQRRPNEDQQKGQNMKPTMPMHLRRIPPSEKSSPATTTTTTTVT